MAGRLSPQYCIAYSTARYVDLDQDANFLHDDQPTLNFTFVANELLSVGNHGERKNKSMQAVPPSCCGYVQYDAAAATGNSGYGLSGLRLPGVSKSDAPLRS